MIPSWLRRAVGPVLPVLSLVVAVGSDLSARAGEVEILRDPWGIPHVFADTDAGAFHGLGYATAEDRGFQMTYSLRIIQGRLSEVVGEVRMLNRNETTLDHDRKMRTFGFYRAARRTASGLDPQTLGLLQAYCDGVNACFRENHDRLHPLFARTGLRPEPWTPADCLASWWHLGQFFATDGTRDLIAGRNAQERPAPARAARGQASSRGTARTGGRLEPPVGLERMPPDEGPAVVKRTDLPDAWIQRVERYARERGLQPGGESGEGPKFSHAWVVGGKRTTTGSSVLVSDPQTPVRNPSLFYEFHFQGKTFKARGIGVPGSPILLVGFTDQVAWGVTALGADQADLFQLETDPARPDQYRFDGRWRPMTVHRETLKVKGREPIEYVVRDTHLGPVSTAFCFARPDEGEVALKRIPICETDRETIHAAIAMIRARDAVEFDAALAGWRFPSANLVFGDRAGNIGYRAVAAIPVRSRLDPTSGRGARPGHEQAQDWEDILPPDLLPGVMNPAAGFLYSGNHRPIESWYPLPLGAMTGTGGDTLRSWRLRERLEARSRFTPEEVRTIHFDAVNPARRDIVRLGLHLRDSLKREMSADARQALSCLESWYRAGASSSLTNEGAELALELNTFFRFVSTELAFVYGGGESGLAYFLKTATARLERDPKAALSDLEQDYIDRSLATAWQSAREKYGEDPTIWNATARTAVTERRLGYYESLDGFPALDPAQAVALPALRVTDGGTIGCQTAQSYTQWVPMHDPDQAQSLLPIGQSEQPGHASRASTLALWGQGDLHPAPLSRAKVEALGVTRTKLAVAARDGASASTTGASRPQSPGRKPGEANWVRAGLNTNLPIWGIRGGLLWGLPPATGQPPDGPRGLIRLRYPTLPNGGYDLLNFIAIEPVVRGRKGFSELEPGKLDTMSGKRLWTLNADASPSTPTNLLPGELTRLDSGVETLTVQVGVERFENGAHVTLTLLQRSDAPDELELAIHAKPDSAPLEYCILTATMGNKARTRQLWLKDEVASSLNLYPDYREPDFAPPRFYPLDRLHRTAAGDVLVAITTDETDPSRIEPFPGRAHWRYAGFPVTQYWRKPAGAWRDDLHVAVNGRYTYWRSRQAIPGGIAFENFELRERFHEDQRFVFGITHRTPGELGFDSAPLSLSSSHVTRPTQRTFNVRDFGALPDGETESGIGIRGAIVAAIQSGSGAEVVLEAGTYRVGPAAPRESCFPIHGATNLVVRGAGTSTKIVITDPAAGGFSVGLGQHVTLRDFTIDYDPVPFCQGTIRAVDAEAGSFDVEVEAGYPTPDAENFVRAIEPYGKWGMIMDRTARRIRSGTPDHYMTPRWEHREGRVWRFFTAEEHHRRNLSHMRVGDAYVHLARGHGSAVFAQGCAGIRIENVTVHASPGLAVGLVGNRGEIEVRGLEVRFAPGTTRLLTANADGIHCQQNRAGPLIEQCYFEGMADDAINLYAPPNVLQEVRSPTQWLVSPGCLVLPGDRLQVLDPKTGRVRGEVKAVEVKPEGRAFLLTIEQPLEGAVGGADHRVADTLYDLDACGAGFQIRGNHMNGNRRYGCLLRAGGGVLEDNTFEDTTGAGVVLTNEPDWPEGPVPWGITIRRNRFLRGGTCLGYADSPHGAALAVRATRLGHGLAEVEAIRDVIVESNEFQDRGGAAVFVGGARGVTIRQNTVKADVGAELRRKGAAILIERSSGVAVLDNTVSDPRGGTTAAVEIGSDVALGEAVVRISGLTADLAPEAKPVLDRRTPR